ncbi:small integral membrane protein 29 isoform X1 [Castor canadensis]|uniref:Small integral membrane protein 29 isoform X1 n=2 Tax=Castor canadensis TaxID=51338 RepID=A0AC58NA30_CASCN
MADAAGPRADSAARAHSPGNAGKKLAARLGCPPPAAQPSAAPYRQRVDPASRPYPLSHRPPPLDWRFRKTRAGRFPHRIGCTRDEAPPTFPGPLITRPPALPGPGSQPRAFLSRLRRRERPRSTLSMNLGQCRAAAPE